MSADALAVDKHLTLAIHRTEMQARNAQQQLFPDLHFTRINNPFPAV